MDYRGISFPFRFKNSGVATSTTSNLSAEHIIESIKQILLTNPDERIMLNDFGSDIRRFAFEGDNNLDGLLKKLIEDKLKMWEDRVEFNEIKITHQKTGIIVNISFTMPPHVKEKIEVTYGNV